MILNGIMKIDAIMRKIVAILMYIKPIKRSITPINILNKLGILNTIIFSSPGFNMILKNFITLSYPFLPYFKTYCNISRIMYKIENKIVYFKG